MILVTDAHRSLALYKAIEEVVMWTVSAFQQHPNTLMICDENSTLDLNLKTSKYLKVCHCFVILKMSKICELHTHLKVASY